MDEQNRERILIGAPVPDPAGTKRANQQAGLIFLDPAGVERIGVGVTDRNRERIVLEADANGGAEISLFNKKTFIAGRLKLRGDDGWELALRKQDGKKIRGRRWTAEKDEAID